MGVAFPAILAGLGLAGAGVAAYGQYAQSQAQSQMYAYQAQVAQNNAKIAQEQASYESQAGEAATTMAGLRTRAKVGSYKAAAGAAGVDVNTGSAADVVKGIKQMGMQDALTLRSDASKKAWGYQVAATGDVAQAQLDQYASANAAALGPIGAAGTLLSGASSVGGQYLKLQTLTG